MVRELLPKITLAACVVVAALAPARAAVAHDQRASLITRCVATTYANGGGGMATFFGNCSNGYSTFLTATSGTVLGRVGGLAASFIGGDVILAGHIGTWRTSYTIAGSLVTGFYGSYRLFFSAIGSSLIGRIGSARVRCFETDSSAATQFTCYGANGGAEAMIPLLVHVYTRAT